MFDVAPDLTNHSRLDCGIFVLTLTNILAFGSIWTRELNLANWHLQFATAGAAIFWKSNLEEKQNWESMRRALACAAFTKSQEAAGVEFKKKEESFEIRMILR